METEVSSGEEAREIQLDSARDQVENPYNAPHWRDIAVGLGAAGRATGLQVTSFFALPARISRVLEFFTESGAVLNKLSQPDWLRVTEGYENSAQQMIGLRCHSTHVGSRHHFVNGRPIVLTGALYEVKYGPHRLLLSLPWEEYTRTLMMNGLNPVVLAASNREALLSIIDDYEDWSVSFEPSLSVWGGVAASQEPEAVREKELILEPGLKKELLAYVDRFWRYKSHAQDRGISYRRGLLLAGRPGTGKTQFVRHLFTRFPDARRHLFVPASGRNSLQDEFGLLLRALNRKRTPAIVVFEDIDQLFASNIVTPQYLLNVLDGLLALPEIILWVATTNDPRSLALNLLDRPGRFDRIVVFREPGADQRAEMLSAFSRRSLSDECLACASGAAEGLAGAHIREACNTAELAELDGEEEYEQALLRELDHIHRQHETARRYELGLEAERETAGFTIRSQ